MTWVVTIDSQYQPGRLVMFARQPNPINQWWTVVIHKAALFTERAQAEALVKKLKYNGPQIRTLEDMVKIVAKWEELHYTAPLKKNNYDRQLSPQRGPISTSRPAPSRQPKPSVGPRRQVQHDFFDREYVHELDHLFGLDGWGSEGR